MSVLSLSHIRKEFDGFVAIKDVSFDVRSGDVFGIIGSNGAGKTTLVNLITGYQQPSSGDIRFGDTSIVGKDPRQITRLGVARSFQIPQLFDHMTVVENVLVSQSASFAKLPSVWTPFSELEKIERARETLSTFDLTRYENAKVSEIPQGIKKLLDVALAAVGNPSVVILDEPTSGVSSEEKFSIMELLIKRFKGAGTTTIFVEHDMELIRKYADNVIALYQGQVIGFGDPAQVLATKAVQEHVIGAANKLAADGAKC